jgi:hypothetical protein
LDVVKDGEELNPKKRKNLGEGASAGVSRFLK